MNNVSSAWNRALLNDNRDYIEEVTILLTDNTVLQISNANIWGGGFTIEDAVSEESNFQIGAAIINKFTLVLNNLYDEYNDYVFEDAVLTVRIGLVTEESTEMIQKGRYTVNSAKYNGSLITLECFDFMSKFDKPYDDSLAVTYPATLDTIVRRACTSCGITLATTDFPHKLYTVTERPESETTTCREVISWVAQIAGCFARMNSLGYLELKWYNQSDLESVMDGLDGGSFDTSTPYSTGDAADGGTFNPWNTGYVYDGGAFTWTNKTHLISSIYSEDISVDDVVITGVRILVKTKDDSGNSSETIRAFMSGTEGYVIEISENPFITVDNAQEIVNWLGTQLNGFTFRKANVSHGSNPAIEAGDVAVVFDRKGAAFPIVVSKTTFSVGSSQTTISAAQTPARNSAARYSAETKNYVEMRKRLKTEMTARQQAQADLAQRIASANGLYQTDVTTQGGGTKHYLHNKTNLNESDIQILVSDVGVTMTANGTDAQPTWYGLTVDGTLIASILSVSGINADWINTGSLSVGGQDNTNGSIKIYNASGTLIGEWNKNGIYVIDGTIGGWSILNDGIRKSSGNLGVGMLPGTNAAGTFLYVSETSGSVTKYPFAVFASGRVNMSKANITGGKIELGGLNDVSGEFSLLNSYGQKCVEIGNYYSNAGRITSNYFSGSTSATAICVGRIYLEGSQLRIQSLVNGAWKDNLWLTESGISPGENRTSVSLNGIHSYTTPQQTLVDVDGFEDYDYETFLTGNVYIQGRVATTSSDFNLMYRLKTHILTVTGTKNRLVSTPDYADRLLYCYETPSPMFGDVGEGVIGEDGKCYITIDPVFAETVSLKQYQVFLQKYGAGECYVSERKGAYFVVEGTPNLSFGWELKAKQIDFDQLRLERDIDVVKTENEHNYPEESAKHIAEIETINYADAAITHIENIMKERTVA